MSGAVIAMVFFCALGAALNFKTQGSETRTERYSRHFLLGLGATGFAGHAAGLFRIPLGRTLWLLLFLAAIGVAFYRRTRGPRIAAEPAHRWSKAAALLAAIPIVVLLCDTATLPLRDYDGRVFWILKARAISHEESITGPFFQGLTARHPHTQYPLMMPLASAALFTLSGSQDDRTIRWIYTYTAIAFLFTVRRALRSVADDTVASWITAAIAWLPAFAANGDGGMTSAYSDTALIAFMALAFAMLTNDETRSWIFPVTISFLPLIKNEGVVALAALAMASVAYVFKTEGKQSALRLTARIALTSLVVILMLSVWRSGIPLEHDENYPHLIRELGTKYVNFPAALGALMHRMGDVSNWGVFWLLTAVAVPIAVVRRRLVGVTAAAVGLVLLLVYAITYTVTNWQLEELAVSSANRLLLHLVPMAAIVIADSARTLFTGLNAHDREVRAE
jgi:hypothetical protein